jgi:hypothetical protein
MDWWQILIAAVVVFYIGYFSGCMTVFFTGATNFSELFSLEPGGIVPTDSMAEDFQEKLRLAKLETVYVDTDLMVEKRRNDDLEKKLYIAKCGLRKLVNDLSLDENQMHDVAKLTLDQINT